MISFIHKLYVSIDMCELEMFTIDNSETILDEKYEIVFFCCNNFDVKIASQNHLSY